MAASVARFIPVAEAATQSSLAEVQKQFPSITWDIGYQPNEIVKLTPPILVNESLLLGENELIQLKHNLPGSQIRYTLDGSDPDSVAGMIYKEPVSISKYTQLKLALKTSRKK